MEANKCVRCGESISERAKFCPSCGTKRESLPDYEVSQNFAQSGLHEPNFIVKHKMKFIIGGIACLVVIALLRFFISLPSESSADQPSEYQSQTGSAQPIPLDSSARIESLLFTGGKDGLSVFFTNDSTPTSGTINVFCYNNAGKQISDRNIAVSDIKTGLSLKSFDINKNAANCGVSMLSGPEAGKVYYPAIGLSIGTVRWDPYGNLSVEFINTGAPVSGILQLGCRDDLGKQVEDKNIPFRDIETGDSVVNFPANTSATRCGVHILYADSNGITPQQPRSEDALEDSNEQSETSPPVGIRPQPSAAVTSNISKSQAASGAPAMQPSTASAQGNSASSSIRSRQLNRDGLQALAKRDPDLAAAKEDFEKAVEADSSNIEALNNLGWIDGRMGNYSLAKTVLQKVLKMDPDRRVAQANLGYVLAKMGDVTGASKHFCRLIALSSSQSAARKVLLGEDKDPDPNVHAAVAQAMDGCSQQTSRDAAAQSLPIALIENTAIEIWKSPPQLSQVKKVGFLTCKNDNENSADNKVSCYGGIPSQYISLYFYEGTLELAAMQLKISKHADFMKMIRSAQQEPGTRIRTDSHGVIDLERGYTIDPLNNRTAPKAFMMFDDVDHPGRVLIFYSNNLLDYRDTLQSGAPPELSSVLPLLGLDY